MRIAITQKKRRWGGQAQHALDLARGLRERGHEVFPVAQPGSEFSRRARDEGFPVFEVPMISDVFAQVSTTWRLARFLRRERIDVLHCHDPRDHQMGCVAAPLGGTRALVRTKHNHHPPRNALSRLYHGPLTSHLIAVSHFVERIMVEGGIAPDHITTVHHFIDEQEFRPRPPDAALRSSLGLEGEGPIVGTVGRLHTRKGIEELVRAIPEIAAGVPGVRFLLVGGHQEKWEKLAAELGVAERIVFTGPVSNVADHLRLMDVAVFPPRDEAFGLVVLEAMTAQRAIVGTRVGGIPEMIEHERNGLLVEPHRPDQLVRAILRLLGDPALRTSLALEARKTASERFTRNRSLESTERVYQAALER